MVTAIIAAGRNWTIDYNAGQACDVVIKVLTCIKTAWNIGTLEQSEKHVCNGAYDHYNYMETRLYVSTQNSPFSYSNQQIYVKNHNQNHFQSFLSRFYILARCDNILVACFSWTLIWFAKNCRDCIPSNIPNDHNYSSLFCFNQHSCIFHLVAARVHGEVLPFLRDCYFSAIKTEILKFYSTFGVNLVAYRGVIFIQQHLIISCHSEPLKP